MHSVKRLVLCVAVLVSGAAAAQVAPLEDPGSVSAVQSRAFRMGHELSLGVGVLPLDAFYKGFAGSVAYTAHFSDTFAWTVGRGTYSYNLDTGLRQQLEQQFGVQPTDFEEVHWMLGSDLMWKPFYGKTAFLNQQVLHFELYGVLGGSVLRMVDTTFRPAVNVGVGARVFTSRSISWRFDATNNVVVVPSTPVRLVQVPVFQVSLAFNFGATE
jgi:outer membrane beta-barrel protein